MGSAPGGDVAGSLAGCSPSRATPLLQVLWQSRGWGVNAWAWGAGWGWSPALGGLPKQERTLGSWEVQIIKADGNSDNRHSCQSPTVTMRQELSYLFARPLPCGRGQPLSPRHPLTPYAQGPSRARALPGCGWRQQLSPGLGAFLSALEMVRVMVTVTIMVRVMGAGGGRKPQPLAAAANPLQEAGPADTHSPRVRLPQRSWTAAVCPVGSALALGLSQPSLKGQLPTSSVWGWWPAGCSGRTGLDHCSGGSALARARRDARAAAAHGGPREAAVQRQPQGASPSQGPWKKQP